MSKTVSLGEIDPAGSRHQGRRSTVALTERSVIVGTATGVVVAFDRETLAERWRVDAAGSVVSAATRDGAVLVGERSERGTIACYGPDGTRRFRYETVADVGQQQMDTRFFRPFVVDVAADERGWYAAARRYERRTDEEGTQHRHFESVVYAFEPDGTERWRYEADASPIALDVRDDRLAVAYNRCTGDHQDGLVGLNVTDGTERIRWDPDVDGQRRVGDVALLDDGAVLTSHGDYRGYRLDGSGQERWQVDLATPEHIDGETIYAYPNHVHATDSGVVFVTGNTYPEEGRETDVLHPEEHTAFGYGPDRERRWTAGVEGFATGLGADGDALAVPASQNFRKRNATAHGCRVFDVEDGYQRTIETEGIVSASAIDSGTVAAIEEPVVYHDDGERLGEYRLHCID